MDVQVSIEVLPNEIGFVHLGYGRLQHNEKGSCLTWKEHKKYFTAVFMESVQTGYDYRGKGMCIVLSDWDCCYYIYSKDKSFNQRKHILQRNMFINAVKKHK